MAGPRDVSFAIRARDRTRAAFRSVRQALGGLARQFTLFRVAAIGGALAGLVAFGNRVGQFAANLRQQSRRTGIGVEGFQRLAFALSQLGNVKLETAATGLQRFFRNAQEALQGNPELLRAFKTLGVSISDLKTLEPEEIFFKLADGFARATDKGKAFEALVQIGDTEIAQLVDALEEGSVAIRKFGEDFDRAGGILKELEVDRLEALGSGFGKIAAAVKSAAGVFALLVSDILGLPGLLEKVADRTLSFVRRLRELRAINRELGARGVLASLADQFLLTGPGARAATAPRRAVNQGVIEGAGLGELVAVTKRSVDIQGQQLRELKEFSVVGQ